MTHQGRHARPGHDSAARRALRGLAARVRLYDLAVAVVLVAAMAVAMYLTAVHP